jgi:hypothetical protein
VSRIRVHSSLDRLERDMVGIVRKAPREMNSCVRDGIRAGNILAQDYARVSAGRHGKLYPRAMSSEMRAPFSGFGALVYSGEYGPDIAKPQGGMSFERGSRNQKPHLDLARSADRIAPSFQAEVGRLPDRWFW